MMDVIHLQIAPVHASLETADRPLLGLIGYILGKRRFGGQKIHSPHEPGEIASYGALGYDVNELVDLVKKLNCAEMRKDGGYQRRGGQRKKLRRPDGTLIPNEPPKGPVLARHINVALPYGVDENDRIEIARLMAIYFRQTFQSAVIFAVHNKPEAKASDAHFLLTEREVADGAVGKKIRELNGIASSARATAQSDGRSEQPCSTEQIRAKFCEICNHHLEVSGAQKIEHKSYLRRGIDKTPQKKRNRSHEKQHARKAAGAIVNAPRSNYGG